MDIFKEQNFLELAKRFKADENCKEYLAFSKHFPFNFNSQFA